MTYKYEKPAFVCFAWVELIVPICTYIYIIIEICFKGVEHIRYSLCELFVFTTLFYIVYYYPLSIVKFYNNHFVLIYPMRFWKRKETIMYSDVESINCQSGKPPTIGVFLKNQNHFDFLPPITKKKTKALAQIVESKGICFKWNGWKH